MDRGTDEQFSEDELVDLALAVVAINGWNRLSIAFRAEAAQVPAGHARSHGGCLKL